MPNNASRLEIVALALDQCGKPYIYGGNGPLYFDCSGLVCFTYRRFGLMPDRDLSSQMLFDYFRGVDVKGGGAVLIPGDGIDCRTSEFNPGNAICFGSGPDRIRHIGLIVDKTWMIEAAQGSSRTRTVGDAVAQGAFVGVNQIKRRTDRVGIINPWLKP